MPTRIAVKTDKAPPPLRRPRRGRIKHEERGPRRRLPDRHGQFRRYE